MAQGGGGFDPLPDAWSEGLFRRDDSAMEKAPSTGIANKSHSIDRRTVRYRYCQFRHRSFDSIGGDTQGYHDTELCR